MTQTLQHTASARLGVRGWLVLITLCGATFMTGLDYSIITVALPAIGRDLGFADAGSLQWVATACLLPTAALMPLFGRVGDLVGRRRLFILGVALFAGLSLVAGLAASPGLLVVARAGQGIAAAMIGPTALALMTTAFSEGPQRTRALGVNGALLSLGFVVGTIGGGLITSGLNWRATMGLLLAMGVLVLIGAATVVTDSAARTATRLDVPGAILASSGLFALVYAISTGAQAGWTSAPTLGALAVAITALAGFGFAEFRHRAPLVPLRLLRSPNMVRGGVAGLITFGMCGGATMLLSLYMQNVLGYSALATGLGFTGEGVAALLGGMIVARIIDARGTRWTLGMGLAIQAGGTLGLVFLPSANGIALLLGASAVMGFGHVLSVVSAVSTMTSGLDPRDQGVAGSLAQMPTFLGAIGVAGLAAIAVARADSVAGEVAAKTATLTGLHTGFAVAGIVAAVGAVSMLLRRNETRIPLPA